MKSFLSWYPGQHVKVCFLANSTDEKAYLIGWLHLFIGELGPLLYQQIYFDHYFPASLSSVPVRFRSSPIFFPMEEENPPQLPTHHTVFCRPVWHLPCHQVPGVRSDHRDLQAVRTALCPQALVGTDFPQPCPFTPS